VKEFVVNQEPKASLKIGDKEFKFRSPTKGEARSFSEQAKAAKDDEQALSEIMDSVICLLGGCKKEDLDSLPIDMYIDLFKYLLSADESKKK